MTLSEQIDALQAKVADLKSSLDASRHETNEQIKARVASAKAKAKAKAAEETVHGQADQARDPVAVVQSRRFGQDGRAARTHRA
jgi:hypothetical protein